MKLSLAMQASLQQTLTPQQIQYLKLLQLQALELEQYIRQEIEQNPMLEEVQDEYENADGDSPDDEYEPTSSPDMDSPSTSSSATGDATEEYIPEKVSDPFEFYELAWQDNRSGESGDWDDDDEYGNQIKDVPSFIDDLMSQMRLLDLTDEELLVAEYLIGNIDSDGYLRRELSEICAEINDEIVDRNLKVEKKRQIEARKLPLNPAREYALRQMDSDNDDITEPVVKAEPPTHTYIGNVGEDVLLHPVSETLVESILRIILQLDPPGIGARTIQECLLAQLHAISKPNAVQRLAIQLLERSYEAFAMKHYSVMARQLGVSEDQLKDALDVIRKLNPKPGGGSQSSGLQTVIPDFIVTYDEEESDFSISVNDSRLPAVRLNKVYEQLKKEARYRKYNKETRDWLRRKFDDAKFLLQAVRQRKVTMIKVMTGIVGLQQDFFQSGERYLRPMIYKDVSDTTGLDVSTICRIVNGKYAATDHGTYELKFFFSESLPNDDGEEISTRVVKQKLKEMIESEPKGKPHSDDKLAKELKKHGLNIARRTVAKYREQMRIPVARLRREL